mmetsp:Transcript_30166/g.64452  ORF Transcript_30166/g.64452 Transcript_30166/m.64452 type:complete len:586 (+) Transcript_30166:240-1997(+)
MSLLRTWLSSESMSLRSSPSKKMDTFSDEDEEEDEGDAGARVVEERRLLKRTHSRSQSYPVEMERVLEGQRISSGSQHRKPAASSLRAWLRKRLRVLCATVFLALLPLITYTVALVVFGIVCSCQKTGVAPHAPCSLYDHWKMLRRHNIADLKTDTGISDKMNSFTLDRYVLKGKEEARSSRVLFIGIVKDAEESLGALTRDLDDLLEYFPHSVFQVCESCSKDNTRKVLRDWQRSHKQGRVSVPTASEWSRYSRWNKCRKRKDDMPDRGVYGLRERTLARLRNECMVYAMNHSQRYYDYMVTIDLDIARLDPKGVLDSFGAITWMKEEKSPWSTVCSNGKYLAGIYRDTYAHRTWVTDTSEHHLVVVKNAKWKGSIYRWVRDKFMHLKERELVASRVKDVSINEGTRKRLYEVNSCFGGLAIYDMHEVEQQECRYFGASHFWGKHSRPDCEHISFNACVAGRYKLNTTKNYHFSKTRLDDRYTVEVSRECGRHRRQGDCSQPLRNPRMQNWQGKASWKVNKSAQHIIVAFGYLMTILDLPLFMFSNDSLFVTSWVILYGALGALLYASIMLSFFVSKWRSRATP